MRAVVDHTAALLRGRRADETASSGETADPGHLGEALAPSAGDGDSRRRGPGRVRLGGAGTDRSW